MARQTFAIGVPSGTLGQRIWNIAVGSRPAMDDAFNPGTGTIFFAQVALNTNNSVVLQFAKNQFGDVRADLTDKFEQNGGFRLVSGQHTLECLIASMDTSEPYLWTPSNGSEVNTFRAALASAPAATSITIFDSSIPSMKFNGVDIGAWKFNGVDIGAAKYNGVTLQ